MHVFHELPDPAYPLFGVDSTVDSLHPQPLWPAPKAQKQLSLIVASKEGLAVASMATTREHTYHCANKDRFI